MGRPPSNGGPAFRFNQNEVAEMEAILREHKIQVPSRDLIAALSEKFSQSEERAGKVPVQLKQVWNWFQNRRFALRSKLPKPPAKLTTTGTSRSDASSIRSAPLGSQPQPAQSGKSGSENPQMEFEAKSGRDGAWYDVQAFLSHRYLDTGELEVRVRCAGFGADEDEWVNVKKHVRQRSLPCESTECFAVLPGDLILCFQEGKEQALYFDAHVLDAQRRRHDVRGCRCRFLVRYDHDQTEEIVPLRKVCRRPETDHRLQQLPTNDHTPVVSQTQMADSQPSTETPKPSNSIEATPANPATIVYPSTSVAPVLPLPTSCPAPENAPPKVPESVNFAPVTTLPASAPVPENAPPKVPESVNLAPVITLPTLASVPENTPPKVPESVNFAAVITLPTSSSTPENAPPKVPKSVNLAPVITLPTSAPVPENAPPKAPESVNFSPVITLPTSSVPETAPADPKQPESATPMDVDAPTNPQADVNSSVNASIGAPIHASSADGAEAAKECDFHL